MVTGIEKFHEAFADYADNYVIIGGVACAYHESEAEQMPRKTKDIDMILVVEALSDAFVKRFWEFVKAANYADCNVGSSGVPQRHQFYRFKNPAVPNYPFQIEFSISNLDILPGSRLLASTHQLLSLLTLKNYVFILISLSFALSFDKIGCTSAIQKKIGFSFGIAFGLHYLCTEIQ